MERKELIAKAEDMGLEFKGNISTVKLEDLIENAEMEAKANSYEMPNEESKAQVKTEVKAVKTKASARQEALLLSKVIITPLDERMRDMPSEMYSVGNKNVGFIKKVVRFGVPTLEPKIILDMLREKKALIQSKTTGPKGQPTIKKRMSPAFSIETLEITEEDLADASKK